MDKSRVAPVWAQRVVIGVLLALVAGLIFRPGDSRSDQLELRDPTAWVASSFAGEILQVNAVTGEVLARLPLSGIGDDVEVAQSGSNAFALNRSTGEVAFVDGRLQAVGTRSPVPGVDTDASLRSVGDLARLITTRAVYPLDTMSGAAGEPVVLASPLGSAVLDPSGALIGVAGSGLRVVTDTVVDVPGSVSLVSVAGARDRSYGVSADPRQLREVTPRGSLGSKRCLTGDITGPLVSTQDPASTRVVVVATGTGVIAISDIVANTCQSATLEDLRGPVGTPVTYGDNAFVPMFRTGEVAVFRLVDAALVRRVPVAQAGNSFELFEKAGVLWVNDAASEQALVINDGGVVRRIDKTAGAALATATGPGGGPRTGATGDALPVGSTPTDGGSTGGAGSGEVTTGDGAAPGTGTGGAGNNAVRGNGTGGSGTNAGIEPDNVADTLAADFTFTSSVVNVDQLVTFTDRSTGNPTAWTWDFGDSTFGSGAKVQKAWETAGTYTVTLNVDNATASSRASAMIEVIKPETKVRPKADFSYSAQRVEVGVAVTFTDRSIGNPTELRWTFGDNTTQTGSVVTKSWPNAGTFIVTLTATNGEGTDTTQIPITVFDKVVPPTALIETSATSATVGQSLSFFSRSSGNATDLKWDFGDRTTGSGASIRHAWSLPGTYTVTLTASNSAGSNSNSLQVTIRERVLPPIARLSASAALVEEGVNVRFTSLSINNPTSTTWDFGDGQGASGPSVVKSWPNAGTYTVSMRVTNSEGSDTATAVVRVLPNIPAPIASFSFAPVSPDTATAVQFTDTSTGGPPSEWRWDFGDGSPESTQRNATHTFARTGTFQVRLTVVNRAGTNSTVRSIVVRPAAPVAAFTFLPAVPLIGGAVQFNDTSTGGVPTTWAWDFGDTTVSALRNPTKIYTVAGTYQVRLTTTNETGTSTIVRPVVVSPPAPIAAFTFARAAPVAQETVTFTNTSTGGPATTISWDFGDGSPLSPVANPTKVYDAPGTYPVTLTVSNAAGTTSVTRNVVVAPPPPPPIPSFTGPASIVAGQAATFVNTSTGGAPTLTVWDFGDGSPQFFGYNPPPHVYATAGPFTITLTMSNPGNPPVSASRPLVVHPVAPTVTINAPVPSPAVAGSPVAFSATVTGGQGPFTYAWTFERGTPAASTSATPSVTFSTIGPGHAVRLTVTDALGRAAAAPVRQVTVVAPPPPTVVVSIVTPAGPYTAPVTVTFRATVTGGLGPYTYSWPALPLLSGATYVGPTNTATVEIQFAQAFSGNIRVNVLDDLGQPDTDTEPIVVAAPLPPPPTTPPPTTAPPTTAPPTTEPPDG
ncbi:MAG TPA: PKD domain-containing protein [Acidimicrobiales bacterium]|nr:PKD domain-containing protein [Acidimicrobiales bacterium]